DAVCDSAHGRLVLVRGEAGIGKTALVRAFRDLVDEDVRVLWAACDPLFTPRPLGPLLDVARIVDGDLRSCIEAGAEPHGVAAALMRELGSTPPTVVVVEDIHWGDEATLDVISLVARRMDSVPALVVATYRDDELGRTHPLRIALGELPSTVARVKLCGLSQ